MKTFNSVQSAIQNGQVGDVVNHFGGWTTERKTIGYIHPTRGMMVLIADNRVESINNIGETTDVLFGTTNPDDMLKMRDIRK